MLVDDLETPVQQCRASAKRFWVLPPCSFPQGRPLLPVLLDHLPQSDLMMRRSMIERIWSAKIGTHGEGVPTIKVLRHARELERMAFRSVREWVTRHLKAEPRTLIQSRIGEAIKEIDMQDDREEREAA